VVESAILINEILTNAVFFIRHSQTFAFACHYIFTNFCYIFYDLPLFSVVIYTTAPIGHPNTVFNKKISKPTSIGAKVKACLSDPYFIVRTGCGCQILRSA
jgi:hypothetical protein